MGCAATMPTLGVGEQGRAVCFSLLVVLIAPEEIVKPAGDRDAPNQYVCMGSCVQCTDAHEVRESERWTEHLLRYVCTVVRSVRTCGRLPRRVWLEEEPVVCHRDIAETCTCK
jgi:hypothetical protein